MSGPDGPDGGAARIAGSLAALLGRMVLLLYPGEFRGDVGLDLVADLRRGASERAAARGIGSALVWIVRNLVSLAGGLLPEWRENAGGGPTARRDAGDWAREIRRAGRTLVRDRAFASTVVVTLTLAIAMTTAVFSVVDGVLLRPLPYPDADRIVVLWQTDRASGVERDGVAVGNFLEWRERTTESFSAMAALEPWGLEYETERGPEDIGTWRVTEDFFTALGTRALHGRTLAAGDFDGGVSAVVTSYDFWQGQLGGDPDVIGRTLRLDGAPVEVVGVMPPDFDLPRGNALWAPRTFSEAERTDRQANYYQVVARLRDGVSLEVARADLARAARQMESDFPRTNEAVGASVVPLPDLVLGPVRPGLLLLLACAGFLLAVACANVASLVIARTNDRLSQLGVRAAMGAGRRDLIVPQALESVILALAAAAFSGLLVTWAIGGLKSLAPTTLPRIAQVSVDARVWSFALAISLFVSLVVSLPATLRASRVDLAGILKTGGRRSTGSRGSRVRRETLVAVQVALALVLVTGAILTGRSVLAVSALDPGYRTDQVAVVTTQVWRQYPTEEARRTFVRDALARLEGAPGVRAVGTTSSLPLAEPVYADQAEFTPEGREEVVERTAGASTVTPGYFEALGIPLLEGRMFDASDGPDGRPVVIVNEELARRNWPGVSPIGERLTVSFAGPPVSTEIIGVVGDVRHGTLEQDPEPRIYVHHPQSPNGAIVFTVRTDVDPEPLIESIKAELWAINGSLAMSDSFAFRELRAGAERERRFYASLLLVFAFTALSIAVVGVYGMGAYTVARQRPEIGIMMALGASPRRVASVFLARSARLLLFGLGLGLLAALGLTRFLRGLLYGLSPTDPATLAGTVLVLGVIGLLATYLPARRASRTDPTLALRAE